MSLCISSIYNRLVLVFLLFFSFSCYSQSNDSLQTVLRVGEISVSGNRITKKNIITRELPFNTGDTIPLKYLNETILRAQQNIFNTQLFIYDSVRYSISGETIRFDIKVKERWYIIPAPIFEIQDRNFNQWLLTRDLFRINYGLALDWSNFTGHRDHLTIIFRRGYSERYGITYSYPYLNKAQTVGINAAFAYSRNNEVAYKTEENILFFHRDYKKYMREQYEGKIGVSIRNHLYQRSIIELLYVQMLINDTVVRLNPDFFGAGRNTINYLSLQYRYSYDKRDNKPYPLKGWSIDVLVEKDGLNFLYDQSLNYLYAAGSVRKYTPLSSRFFMANQVKCRYLNTDYIPYYFNRALGYNDFIRGYEYYVMDGQSFGLIKNSLKYQLVKQRVVEAKFLSRFPQFSTIPYSVYLNVNFDAGYVEDKFYGSNNPLNNSFQYGYGLGLDLVTYYDIVIRLEYSFNKRLESGFFIHMSAGI